MATPAEHYARAEHHIEHLEQTEPAAWTSVLTTRKRLALAQLHAQLATVPVETAAAAHKVPGVVDGWPARERPVRPTAERSAAE